MLDMWWPRRRKRQQELSAFADGELSQAAADRVAERVVFDDDAHRELTRLRRMDVLVSAALAPAVPWPDGDTDCNTAAAAAADAVCARLHVTPAAVEGSRNWTPAVVASVGLLVTAGVAFAGAKRRGWLT